MIDFSHEIELLRTAIWLEKATKEERMQKTFVASVTRTFTKDWMRHARPALDAGVKAWDGKSHSKAAAAKVAAAVEKELKGFGAAVAGTVSTQISDLYEGLTAEFLQKQRLTVQKATASGPRGSLTVNFTQLDEDAIDMIQKFTNISAGREFPAEIMGKVSEVTNAVVLEEGQAVETAAEELRKRLEEELAGALGIQLADVIPDAFATNPEAYFEVLANNAAVMSQNAGRIVGMADAGVRRYRVVTVRDERTSEICKNMDGRIISVDAGIGMLNKMLELSGPQALAETFPWDSTLSNLGPNTLDNNNALAAKGLGFPPYHGNCRSTVVPEFE